MHKKKKNNIKLYFLYLRPPPRATRTCTTFPCTTLLRSHDLVEIPEHRLQRRIEPACAVIIGGRDEFILKPETIEERAQHRIVVMCEAFEFRSEEHTSELQSLMCISFAVLCL